MKSTLVVLALALSACTIGGAPPPPAEGEGEGAEGEGEGADLDGPVDVGTPPQGYGTTAPANTTHCSTGQWWTLGDRQSDSMHPGGDCMTCHAQEDGPSLALAGTVMGRSKDELDCRGVPGVTVEIIASDGSVALSEDTNDGGNLFATGDLSSISPYTIRLTYQGRKTQMTTPQTDGNCMHCHTVDGLNNAPGRIVAP